MTSLKRRRRKVRKDRQKRNHHIETLEHRRLLAQLSVSGSSIQENAGTVEFTVRLSEQVATSVRATFDTVNGTALAGTDFVGIQNKEITFAPGETSKQVTVELLDNVLRDGDRSFFGNISSDDVDTGANGGLFQLTNNGDVSAFVVSPDGKTVVYSAGRDRDLYSVPIDGSAAPTSLNISNPTLPGHNSFLFFDISPDSSHVVLASDFESSGAHHVYSVPIDGSSNATRLSGPLASGATFDSVSFLVTPDSQNVVYKFRGTGESVTGFHSVPLNGSAPPTFLGNGDASTEFEITKDSKTLVYQGNSPEWTLFSVPVDGSAQPIALSDGIPGAVSVQSFFNRMSPDGEKVVFNVRLTNSLHQLFSTSVDGSTEPVSIASSVSGATRLTITADSNTVVFRVDKGIVQPKELFTVSIDGSAEPMTLHPQLADNQNVWDYRVSQDGNFVLYEARQDSDGTDLYFVPSNGSLPATRLTNSDQVGSVSWSQLSPDNRWATFSTFKSVDGESVTRLYGVPTDGSSAPIPLSPISDNIYLPREAVISSDSKTVTYLGYQDSDRELQLYNVPLDGSEEATRVNKPLPPEGTISRQPAFEVTPFGIVHKVHDDSPLSSPPQVVDLYSNTLFATGHSATATATIIDDDLLVADFGDAPLAVQSGFSSDYPVTIQQDGARHTVGELFLGTTVDIESDGQPDVQAGQSGIGGDNADEDGIELVADLIVSANTASSSLRAMVSQPGKLDAWIDFNRDGDWTDIGEQILVAEDVVTGENLLAFPILPGAIAGDTGARFRLSTTGGLAPTGVAADGEVEDYWLTIVDNSLGTRNPLVELIDQTTQVLIENGNVVVRGSEADTFSASTESIEQIDFSGSIASSTLQLSSDFLTTESARVSNNGLVKTLQVSGPTQTAEVTLDLTEDGNVEISNVEVVESIATGPVQFVLDTPAVAQLTSNAPPMIRGNQNDRVTLARPADWRMGDVSIVDGTFVRQVENIVGGGERFDSVFPHAWQNLVQIHDVNNSGDITSLDALRVINKIATLTTSGKSFDLPIPTGLGDWEDIYFDTSGDDRVSALDALLVINFLLEQSQGTGSAEGEVVRSNMPSQTVNSGRERRFSDDGSFVSHLQRQDKTAVFDWVPFEPWEHEMISIDDENAQAELNVTAVDQLLSSL